MDMKEYEKFAVINGEPPIVLGYCSGVKDRTLLYGYTCDRNTWHVYLFESKINLFIKETGFHMEGEMFPICELIPDKRLYPEACDLEFCEELNRRGFSLPFTTFNQRRKSNGAFFGEIKQVVPIEAKS